MKSGSLIAVAGLGALALLLLSSRSSASSGGGNGGGGENPCTKGLPPQIAELVEWALTAPRGDFKENPFGQPALEIQPGPLFEAADKLEAYGFKDAARCLRARAKELEPKDKGTEVPA